MRSAAAQPRQSIRPQTTPPTPRAAGGGYYVAAFAAILLAAAALRAAASLNEFWFDEIWSYGIARDNVKGPLDALAVVHENNSPLNTLLIHWIGADMPFWAYRIPAILAGVGTVALAGLIALRWGRAESVTALVVTAFSFLLIQYSSEARGYGLAVLFSMLCLLLGLKYVERPRPGLAVLLWVFLAAAWLSHLTAVFFYASFLLWSAYALVRAAGRWRGAIRPALMLHVAPLAMLAVFYWTFVRKIVPGRTQEDGTLNVLARTVALWVGAPLGTAGTIVAGAAVLCGTALGLGLLVRRRESLWVFFASVLSLSPATLLAGLWPAGPYERHFLVFLSFGLLLLALALGWVYRRGAWGKALLGLLLAGFLAGSAWHTAWLLKVGRGHCVEAIRYLAKNTPGDTILVASDHDVRVFSLMTFYEPRADVNKTLVYWTRDKLEQEPADWLILHRQLYSPMPRYTADVCGHIYELATSFEMMSPAHPLCLSGWSMYLYRFANASIRVAPGSAPGP